MKVSALPDLPGPLLLEPRVFRDDRGSFMELHQEERYAAVGIADRFVQDNLSTSRRNVLRGLHLQHPHGQGKLITVLQGEVFDVAVDVRRGSPTFGRWAGMTLSAGSGQQLWIPPGFAHGFLALSEQVLFSYKCTQRYVLAHEITIRWDDPTIGIEWPVASPILSEKDATAPTLAELPAGRLPVHQDG